MIWRENELTPQTPRYYPKAQIRQGADRDRTLRVDHLSPQTSYRLDNRHCAGAAKNSDENQVAAIQRKAKTKTREQGKSDQLP